MLKSSMDLCTASESLFHEAIQRHRVTVSCAVTQRQDKPITKLPNAWPEILSSSSSSVSVSVSVSSSFLASGSTRCSRDTVKAVNLKRRWAGTSSEWHSRYPEGCGGWDFVPVPRSHFIWHPRCLSCCLKVIRMLVCMKVRRCCVRSWLKLKIESFQSRLCYGLWSWGAHKAPCCSQCALFQFCSLCKNTKLIVLLCLSAVHSPWFSFISKLTLSFAFSWM